MSKYEEAVVCIERAMERLKVPGAWTNRKPRADGEYCVLTALVAEASSKSLGLITYALYMVLKVSSIAGWNDTPGRTLDEVLAALEAARIKLKEMQ